MRTRVLALLTAGVAMSWLLTGCWGGLDPDDGDGGVAEGRPCVEEFWGRWIRMDQEQEWYISVKSVVVDQDWDDAYPIDSASDTAITIEGYALELRSENVIRLTDGEGAEFSLFRNGGRGNSFSGRVLEHTGGKGFGLGGLGGISVTITNVTNPEDTHTVTTDPDGGYEVEDTIAGDTYEVVPDVPEAPEIPVTPQEDDQDTGAVTVTPLGYNFKVTPLIPNDHFMYADGNETGFTLELMNVGTEDCLAPTYDIQAVEADLTLTSETHQVLGTVEPDAAKYVDVVFSIPAILDDAEDRHITVIITDVHGNVWEDTATFRVYKLPVIFTVRATQRVHGIVLSPEKRAVWFSTGSNSSGTTEVAVPRRTAGYTIALSGASADTEAKYSIGFVADPVGEEDLDAFATPSAFEPNDSEAEMTEVGPGETVTAYLHKNDVDYFRFDLMTAVTPEFSVEPGGYATSAASPWSEELVISTATVGGASIRYTTDGTTPTESHGTEYTGPMTIDGTTRMRAVAYKDGWGTSLVSELFVTVWEVTDLGASGTGSYNSIAVDSAGNPGIAYYRYVDRNLGYLKWNGVDWTGTASGIVDESGSVGQGASLAFDSSDRPRVAYYDYTNDQAKYAAWNGSGWDLSILSGTLAGQGTVLALDSADVAHVVYRDYESETTFVYHRGGTAHDVAAVGGGWRGGSLALDDEDGVHMCFSNPDGGLWYYYGAVGGIWERTELVDDREDFGAECSMAVDSEGHAHIVYRDGSRSYTSYLWYAQWDGDGWRVERVGDRGIGRYCSIAIDSADRPHIVCLDEDSYSLRYFVLDGGVWSSHLVAGSQAGSGTFSPPGWCCLALDDSDGAHISYHGGLEEDEKYLAYVRLVQ